MTTFGKWTLVLALAATFTLQSSGHFSALQRGRLVAAHSSVKSVLQHEHESKRAAALGEGEMWYGGKPSIPVRIESSLEGEIPTEQWISVTVSVSAEMDCKAISVRFRGVDLLEVANSDWDTQDCRPEEAVKRVVDVRLARSPALPSGDSPESDAAPAVLGYLAVDLEVDTLEGVRTVTRAVEFRPQGWAGLAQQWLGN